MFDPKDMNAAKGWVTGNCNGLDTETRWQKETPVLAQEIIRKLEKLGPYLDEEGALVLDFGCGPGRVAKQLLKSGPGDIRMVCVDASEDMRRLAQQNLKRFVKEGKVRVLSVEEFAELGEEFDLAYCVYVLQHVKLEELSRIVDLVHRASDVLLLVNSVTRLAVTDKGFQNDGRNVLDMISRRYTHFEWALPAESIVTDPVHRNMFLEGDLRHYAFWCSGRKEVERARRVILKQDQSPGDIAAFTRAVVDLKGTFPDWEIDVRTPCPEIFEGNEFLTPLAEGDPDVEQFKITYPEVHNSGWSGIHFVEAFHREVEAQLGVRINRTSMRPYIVLRDEEKGWIHQAKTEFGIERFWILNGGYKPDCFLKYYPYWQEVVSLLVGVGVNIVQVGHKSHKHPPLVGAYSLVGKTDLRQLIRLAYWSDGLMGPISFQMHLAAALEKPSVVVAGGKEPVRWEAYPNHRYLNVNGCIDCCRWDGCWKSKKEQCAHLLDGDVPLCYEMIQPQQVADAVLSYYGGGLLGWPEEWNGKKEEANAS